MSAILPQSDPISNGTSVYRGYRFKNLLPGRGIAVELSRMRRVAVTLPSISWVVCGAIGTAAVGILALWIALDPILSSQNVSVSGGFQYSWKSFWDQVSELNGIRFFGIVLLLVSTATSLGSWIALMLFGRVSDRSIRSGLAFTGVIAFWLGCIGSWQEIAWAGKQWRAVGYVHAFTPIAEELRTNWPKLSGEHKLTGMYMSYPTVQPRTMILMACPELPALSLSFNGVERTPDGGIAFHLVGADGGDWLEWHPANNGPSSYLTGLQQSMNLTRSAKLIQGWFLVRYVP